MAKEDPEEVAAREAGDQAPLVEEADKKVIRSNAKADEEVDSAVHTPHIVRARKR